MPYFKSDVKRGLSRRITLVERPGNGRHHGRVTPGPPPSQASWRGGGAGVKRERLWGLSACLKGCVERVGCLSVCLKGCLECCLFERVSRKLSVLKGV